MPQKSNKRNKIKKRRGCHRILQYLNSCNEIKTSPSFFIKAWKKKEGSAGNFHHHFHLLQNMDHCQTWQNFFFYAKFDILPVIFFNAFSCSFHFLFYWFFFLIFQAFFPSTLDSIQQIHSSSSVKHNNQWNNDGIKYWVPTKHEANQALRVPSEPIISSQVSNEIEFQKSNELLIPGKNSIFFFSFKNMKQRNETIIWPWWCHVQTIEN